MPVTSPDTTAGAASDPSVVRPDAVPVLDDRALTRYALVLGALTAVGPLGIDMYLPAFPAIAASLQTSDGAVQLSLVSYFVALAVGQAIYGPVSDRVGRKGPLFTGFLLFALASLAASQATSVAWLIAARFLQGFGACAGMVVTRSIVRDVASGERAARLFAMMVLVLGVSPILAPSIGSLLLTRFAWPVVFWFMAAFGGLCLLLIAGGLRETLPASRRSSGLRPAFGAYGHLLRDGRFIATVLTGGLVQAGFFAYLAGSPFVFISLFGVTPSFYSVLFGLNAVALVGASQFAVGAMRRFGPPRLVRIMTGIFATSAITLLVTTGLGVAGLPLTFLLLFICIGCQGLIFPTVTMLALEPYGAMAGAASAMMGALQFACGAASGAAVSALFNGTGVPMAGVIAACGTAAFLLGQRSTRMAATAAPPRPAAPAA